MKKIMSIILVIVITAMCFTACGKNKEEREEDIQESKTLKSKTFIITDEEPGGNEIEEIENEDCHE